MKESIKKMDKRDELPVHKRTVASKYIIRCPIYLN